MKIFKRKQAQPDISELDTEITENSITASDFENIPLDEKTQKQIADSDIAENTQIDEVPSANENERDAGNNRKLKFAIVGVISTLVILTGLGATVGRWQEKRAEDKALEAQQAAQAQKKMATGNSIDVTKDQKDIENTTFHDLPAPASAVAPMSADMNRAHTDIATPQSTYIEPVEPIITPAPKPKYSGNDNLVAGRDYSLPAPVAPTAPANATPSPMVNLPDPMPTTSTTVEIPSPKGADSNVLVDVNAVRVSATATSEQKKGGLAGNFTPTVLADGQAGRRGDTSMLLLKGTNIPCVLKTKIDSTYQGFTVCQMSKDVYSSNGKTLLIERGSTVFGEQNTQIQQGQARVSVLWNRIETPKGISINIDSPATGQLGEMGVGAKVNNHFWKRFGSSIMLSLIQDGLAAATKRIEGEKQTGDNNTTVSNSSSTVESMAEKALSNTINMPPTAIVKQGTMINILVARDVDFGGIYKLTRR